MDCTTNPSYFGPERRNNTCPLLDPVSIDEIADKAAEKAVEKLTKDAYAAIGKGVVNKIYVIVGVIAAAAYLWLSSKGFIKVGG